MALSANDKIAIEQLLGRQPTVLELTIFDTMWSEHCSYKSSKRILKQYLPTKGRDVSVGIGEDSGIIRFAKVGDDQYCIAISHESHNHPSQILPVEGAATGVGGVVRDVYCMGADVIGVLNSLHFGIDSQKNNPLVEEIADRVVQGVSDYANPLGVPVMGGETVYHESYNDNCLVNVAALGIVKEADIIHSYTPARAANHPYDVILIGKSTDSTGFGGASFASATLDEKDDAANMGAVQVHDPFLKRVLVEALKAVLAQVKKDGIEIGYKDLGAGGIACATSEIAAAGGFGVRVDIEKVNVGMPNLRPEVIACSETQERFCMVVPREYSPVVLKIVNEDFELPQLYPNAGAVVIGEIVNDPFYELRFNGERLCNLPISTITTDVAADRRPEPRLIEATPYTGPMPTVDRQLLLDVVADINACSKRYVYRFFDNAVRGDTVIYPGEGDAVVTTPVPGSSVGLVASMDSNLYGNLDPYVSGAYAVAEAVRNVIAAGGEPLAVTDCLNYGNPERGPVFFDFEMGVKGIADAAHALSFIDGEPIPVISGNVSFYNESTSGTAVVPSPVIVVIGRVPDYRLAQTARIKRAGHKLIMVGQRYAEFGATLISKYKKELGGCVPQLRWADETAQNKVMAQLIHDRMVVAAHDISGGGAWVSLVEMILGEHGLGQIGVALNLGADHPLLTLGSENGGYLIEVEAAQVAAVETALTAKGVWFATIGETINEPEVRVVSAQMAAITLPISDLKSAWLSEVNRREVVNA